MEEDYNSDSSNLDNNNEPPSKKSKLEGTKKGKFKQPTVEELSELNETAALFNNNLLRLQISELLKAVKIKQRNKTSLNTWLESFQGFLDKLPIHDLDCISNFSRKPAKRPSRDQRFIQSVIAQCRSNLYCDKDVPITFMRPDSLGTFGLYKVDALPGPQLSLNIHLNMKKQCFHEKDFLNNRYFVKKFYFLMYIAEHLKLAKLCLSIKCSYYNDNVMIPYLQVKPAGPSDVTVNIFAIPEQSIFKSERFLPDMNNVKVGVFDEEMPVNDIEHYKHIPTLYYNASLSFDICLMKNQIFIEETLSDLKNVQEGLKLIVIWMNQREFNEGLGSFSNDVTVYILIHLIQKRKINKHMSSYQVFRNFLNFMNITDLTRTTISVCENISNENLEKFKSSYDVVVIDETGFHNVAAFVNRNVYEKLKNECKLAFNALDQNTSTSFRELLLFKIPKFLQYDGVIEFKTDDNFLSLLKLIDDEEKVKYLGMPKLIIMKYIETNLKLGLNNRVVNIVPLSLSPASWDYGTRYTMTSDRMLFGIQLNPDRAFDILEFGPNLNDPGEAEFKEFWGEMASNRRFQDGTARVVVHFETKTIKDKRDIIKLIVNHVATQKLELEYDFYYNEFEKFLLNPTINAWYPIGTNEETSIIISRASDELAKKIREVDMQLSITGINGVSSVFCYTDVFPQIPTHHFSGKQLTKVENKIMLFKRRLNAVPKYVPTVECLIHLEHSSKWPSNLEAFQNMKSLFYVNISTTLKEKYQILSDVKPDFIDIFYKGIVFRYRFQLKKEIVLLKREIDEKGMIRSVDTPESLEAEKRYNVIPRIIGALKGIQGQFPSFGVSSCLAKRWLRSQLIDDYLLPDIVIDLLNSYQFINPTIYSPAVSPQVAFFRFLKNVVEAQWDLEPLVLNFNDELTKEQILDADNKLRANRDKYPPLFIQTPYDNGESIFTKTAPTKDILCRLKSITVATLQIIDDRIMNQSLMDIDCLFTPNPEGYDCVIHLRNLSNPRRHEQIFKNDLGKITYVEPSDEDQLMPIRDFDPVAKYLKILRDVYGAFCIFFHDSYGGNTIGVLFKRKEAGEREFKLANMLGRTVQKGDLVLNKREIVTGFEVFGEGIVKSVSFTKQ